MPNSPITRHEKRARLFTIIRVLKKYDAARNFIHQQNPAAVRKALEELGPTFIKAGQILSTRPDLVSPAYITEFRKLQDNVPADDFSTVQQTFTAQTGKTIAAVFASFDPQPFASASIGQTHHATLKDGTPVVVKVQHPNVRRLVRTDLALFQLAVRMLRLTPEIGAIDPAEVLSQIRTSLTTEINTAIEIKNGVRFYQLNNNDGVIRVPRVYTEYSTQKILVTTAMPGKSIKDYVTEPLSSDPQLAAQQQAERREVAQVLVQNFIKQVFHDNFFHADPHPGNILFYRVTTKDKTRHTVAPQTLTQRLAGNSTVTVQKGAPLPDYRLVYLDFGMMGTLTPDLVDGMANVIIALTTGDTHEIGKAILAVCNRTGTVDEEEFYGELGSFLAPYLTLGLGQIDFPVMLYNIIALCRKNNLQVRAEITLLVKAFGSLEGIVAQLDPHLSLMDVARPFAKEYLKSHFNLRRETEAGMLTLLQALHTLPQLPTQLTRMLSTFNQGQARLTVKYKGQERLVDRLEQIASRLSITIILAAIILGSSLLVAGSPHSGVARLGVCGYVIALLIIGGMAGAHLRRWFHRWRHRK